VRQITRDFGLVQHLDDGAALAFTTEDGP
jgi:hypothetical protein